MYAIALGAPRDGVGARGEQLHVLARDGLEVVWGDPPPPLSADALRAHEAAVRRIADAAEACLPARFGSSAGDEDSLATAVSARAAELGDALTLVRGREQMTLRVHGAPADVASGAGPGTRYLEARRRSRALPELESLRTALAGLVRAERVEEHSEPGLLASVYHLIDRGGAQGYRHAVEATPLPGLRVILSGPWPAWSFAPEVAP